MKNILIYQEVTDIIKANVINTVNIAKGFIKNNYNVYFYVYTEEYINFYNHIFSNCSINFLIRKKSFNIIDFINNNDISVIYVRDVNFPKHLIDKKYDGYIILEDHNDILPDHIEVYRKYDKFIFTSIAPVCIKSYNIKKKLLFPCSIDFNYFSKYNCINNVFNEGINITYCGHLYDYKGIPLILLIAKILKEYNFNIIGGKLRDIKRHKLNATENVKFYGHQNYLDIPKYLYSSDLLLIPYNRRGSPWSKSNITSPIKLFEYLSTKVPVLCSSIDGIRNWVTDKEVTFFKPGSIKDFKKKIRYIINNRESEDIKNKIAAGLKKAEMYSTKNKCKKLLELIK
tara:strand:+ start:175 stop:1200 length:1026 start_codon:yes stop_codon:yes gene_type:complete